MKDTEQLIGEICDSMKELLLEKNRNYGDSATNPQKIFSKQSAVDAICARIDDKLMRISNRGITDETEDTVSDLIGYLVLLKVALRKEDYKRVGGTGYTEVNDNGIKYEYSMEEPEEEEEEVDLFL